MPAETLAATEHNPTTSTVEAALGASFSKKEILLVLALTLLALGLRLYHLSSQSLWIDEAYSVFTASVPLEQVYSYSTKVSNSLPTYFLILRVILPNNDQDIEWYARVLSAVAGGLSAPLFAGIVFYWRRKMGAALLAGLLLAINPLHIWYSQEARAYALMLFFGLLAVLFLELAFASRRSEWLTLYFFASLAAVLLHRSALVFPALCCTWHAVHLVRQRQQARNPKEQHEPNQPRESPSPPVEERVGERRQAAGFKQLFFHLPIGIVALLLMFIKLNPPPEGYRHAGSVLLQFGYTFMTFLGGYSFGPSLGEIQNLGASRAVLRGWFQVVLLVLVLAPIGWVCAVSWRRLLFTKEAVLLSAGIGIAAVAAMISGFAYNVRYVLPGLFGFLSLIATLMLTVPDRRQLVRGILAAVVAVSLWADAQWFYSPRYDKPDARGLAKWLLNNEERVKSWTIVPGYMKFPLYWYMGEAGTNVASHSLVSTGQVTISFPPVPDVLILQRRDQIDQPDKLINAYQVAAGHVKTNLSFAGFELYLNDSPPPSDAVRSDESRK